MGDCVIRRWLEVKWGREEAGGWEEVGGAGAWPCGAGNLPSGGWACVGPEAGSPAVRRHLPSYAIMGLLRHYFHKHTDSAYIGRHIYGDPRPTDKSGRKPTGER